MLIYLMVSTFVCKVSSHNTCTHLVPYTTYKMQMLTGAPGAGEAQLSTPEGSAMESGASHGQDLRTDMAGLAIFSPVAGQRAGDEGGEAAL